MSDLRLSSLRFLSSKREVFRTHWGERNTWPDRTGEVVSPLASLQNQVFASMSSFGPGRKLSDTMQARGMKGNMSVLLLIWFHPRTSSSSRHSPTGEMITRPPSGNCHGSPHAAQLQEASPRLTPAPVKSQSGLKLRPRAVVVFCKLYSCRPGR